MDQVSHYKLIGQLKQCEPTLFFERWQQHLKNIRDSIAFRSYLADLTSRTQTEPPIIVEDQDASTDPKIRKVKTEPIRNQSENGTDAKIRKVKTEPTPEVAPERIFPATRKDPTSSERANLELIRSIKTEPQETGLPNGSIGNSFEFSNEFTEPPIFLVENSFGRTPKKNKVGLFEKHFGRKFKLIEGTFDQDSF